jgi:hypothetical protein
MLLLANENFPRVAIDALRVDGHDVLWVRTECPGATDEQVLQLAQKGNRILLTLASYSSRVIVEDWLFLTIFR